MDSIIKESSTALRFSICLCLWLKQNDCRELVICKTELIKCNNNSLESDSTY